MYIVFVLPLLISLASSKEVFDLSQDFEQGDETSNYSSLRYEPRPSSITTSLGRLQNDFENTGDSAAVQLTPSTSSQSVNISDGVFQRIGNTDPKTSGLSSHTSAGLADTNIEEIEFVESDNEAKLSSPSSSLSSQLSPAKSATPASLQPEIPSIARTARRNARKKSKPQFLDLRPRTSIPINISHQELARQSIHAALSSRLNPYSLHPEEHQLLRNHICQLHATAYLNIRNRIVRLWVRNPLVSVSAEEAAGCAMSSRWLGLAEIAYEWLVRKGYINFGCVEISDDASNHGKRSRSKGKGRKTIIVVGAGMAGLGCARQLEGLFSHYHDRWESLGEQPPKVMVLEGRSRLGGRIYSHPLQKQELQYLPKHSRCTAEMGAHIITGFDHGNPLNMIIRGQLALHYYPLKDNSTLYDVDGKVVARDHDKRVERLFNDVLDRASVYRHKMIPPPTTDGDKGLIEVGRDPSGEAGDLISVLEGINSISDKDRPDNNGNDIEQVPGGVDKLTGKANLVAGSRTKAPAVVAAEQMGWTLLPSSHTSLDIDLEEIVRASEYPTLGATMDEAIKQYQHLLGLTPLDMRLLNWHFANLEYANAANVGKLSLGGWDQDIGNEFEGEHAQIIGGYQQVPLRIWQHPSKLDLRTRKAVQRVIHSTGGSSQDLVKIICDDGEEFEADHVILTVPLGVLKDGSIKFEPELPDWKTESIQRLGFGTLNKVVLVYEETFWDVNQDMVGLLRQADQAQSVAQEDYIPKRGRFYLFWNCVKTSGRPVLIALMAGDAAHQAEFLSDGDLVSEVTEQLAMMYKPKVVPQPSETIVTRWGKDRFARGSYSYVGATASSHDYDTMARRVGNVHFAGEATCGTHPATVHGAYLSGLRAASEVLDALLGPISISDPLVPALLKTENSPPDAPSKRKHDEALSHESSEQKQTRLETFETEILKAIFAKLGLRPAKPGKPGANPFLLFSKDKWSECKTKCDEARQAAVGNSHSKASRNEVRAALGLMWREAGEEVKRPYVEKTVSNRQVNHESAATFHERLAEWDAEAIRVRKEYVDSHPGVLSAEEEQQMWNALGVGDGHRRAKRVSRGYAESSGSEMDE